MRGMTLDELLLARSSSFCNIGVFGFIYRLSFIFESLQISEFSTDLQDYGL